MSESGVSTARNVEAPVSEGRLAAAIREVKNAFADRDDVVVDIREAQLTRLELLADDLKPVFVEVPPEDDWFDLVISSGTQPRLWIDAVAHVTMARDQRTYRFLRDTRLGRIVLAESAEIKPVVEQVTRYIAERMVERERILAGETIVLNRGTATAPVAPAEANQRQPQAKRAGGSLVLRAFWAVLIGGLVGAGAVLLFSGTLLERLGTAF